MTPNPFIGVLLHWLGGLASASFYVPFRKVRGWSWETYWLIGGVFSWIIAPLAIGQLMTRDLFQVLAEAPGSTLGWCYFFGVLWGFGGLTFGLTMRYLGISLGTALALGYCALFGTLAPPVVSGTFPALMRTRSGVVILAGVVVCLVGIGFAAMAGISKERELRPEERTKIIEEFNLRKGVLVATFCGIMSACMSFGLAAGDAIRDLTMRHGTPRIWQGLPILVVVLLGGFTTNAVWCLVLHLRRGSGAEYLTTGNGNAPLLANYIFSGLAGVIWYMQFFFYTMGETEMGSLRFSSWTLHMASIMIFGSLWGLALREWRGAGRRTMRLLALSLLALIASTLIIGYGNYAANAAALQG
ncbi:MAG TPA: L-rhamnose/proton symporter RhaT [Bryobacteraceae bacterium]|jgi:L-rhamnose-H+ transport protein|nr:L-rhamnose/proton symporter RhaT [Bryobacteraceae bacterium]